MDVSFDKDIVRIKYFQWQNNTWLDDYKKNLQQYIKIKSIIYFNKFNNCD